MDRASAALPGTSSAVGRPVRAGGRTRPRAHTLARPGYPPNAGCADGRGMARRPATEAPARPEGGRGIAPGAAAGRGAELLLRRRAVRGPHPPRGARPGGPHRGLRLLGRGSRLPLAAGQPLTLLLL